MFCWPSIITHWSQSWLTNQSTNIKNKNLESGLFFIDCLSSAHSCLINSPMQKYFFIRSIVAVLAAILVNNLNILYANAMAITLLFFSKITERTSSHYREFCEETISVVWFTRSEKFSIIFWQLAKSWDLMSVCGTNTKWVTCWWEHPTWYD